MSKDDIIINIPTQTQMETYSNVHKEKDCNASLENAQTTTKYSLLYSTISCIVEFQYKRPHPLTCSGSQTLVDWRPDLGPGHCTRQGSVVSHDASLSGAPSVGGAS